MDLAKLNTGELVKLFKDNVTVQFAPGKWSLVAKPPRYNDVYWVRVVCIAKRYTVNEQV